MSFRATGITTYPGRYDPPDTVTVTEIEKIGI